MILCIYIYIDIVHVHMAHLYKQSVFLDFSLLESHGGVAVATRHAYRRSWLRGVLEKTWENAGLGPKKTGETGFTNVK